MFRKGAGPDKNARTFDINDAGQQFERCRLTDCRMQSPTTLLHWVRVDALCCSLVPHL